MVANRIVRTATTKEICWFELTPIYKSNDIKSGKRLASNEISLNLSLEKEADKIALTWNLDNPLLRRFLIKAALTMGVECLFSKMVKSTIKHIFILSNCVQLIRL